MSAADAPLPASALAPLLPQHDGRGAMPAIGFGTWRCDADKLEPAVYHALARGYRHIDCAPIYRNEHIVGAAIARAVAAGLVTRDALYITSKLPMTSMRPELVRGVVEKSIADLGVGYLDLFVVHWPYALDPACTVAPPPFAQRLGYTPEHYLSVWRAMEALVDEGLVRALGCSNMTVRKLEALWPAAVHKPVNIQVELHPFLAQHALKAYCDARGILMTGYHPLGSPSRPAQYRAEGNPDVLGAAQVTAIAAATGRTPAQVVLRWAVQRGTVPLPRSTTPGRVEENFTGVLDWALSGADMSALDALDAPAANSAGRIMRGDHLTPEGADWHDVWDEDFDAAAATAAVRAAAAAVGQ